MPSSTARIDKIRIRRRRVEGVGCEAFVRNSDTRMSRGLSGHLDPLAEACGQLRLGDVQYLPLLADTSESEDHLGGVNGIPLREVGSAGWQDSRPDKDHAFRAELSSMSGRLRSRHLPA